MPTIWWLNTLKRIQKIIRESAFDKKKTNPGLVLTIVPTTGPRLLGRMRHMTVCSQHLFGLLLRMNGMHRTHFDHARLDIVSLVIWSSAFWLSLTWNFMAKIMSNQSNSKINIATLNNKKMILKNLHWNYLEPILWASKITLVWR